MMVLVIGVNGPFDEAVRGGIKRSSLRLVEMWLEGRFEHTFAIE